ncbi:MAG: EscU/YscU/HrcU family type III secretion system export apparatus switch protein [Candidatus Eremiobacteraeota bacterium]|nr:EscU/YscU/HrcU family type III secretion system export apparatus switch protein [Candidatus Eremiobacteraeota bacterium]
MAESKPHEPTPTWLARAKREGNVARSQEVSGLGAFLAGAIAVAALAPAFGLFDAAWITRAAADGDIHVETVAPLLGIIVTIFLVTLAGGVTAAVLQERPFFIFPKVKAERLNPFEGVKRMFSREAVTAAMRALLAFVLAGAALVPTAREVFARGAGFAPIAFFATLASSAAARIVLAVVVVGAAFATFDILIVRGRWRKKLRMNAAELKRDTRENDGDPLLRGRRRMLHRALKTGSLAAVKDAAFVVTNPTHIAIALDYRPPEVAVPRILVRAADENAARVREMARRYGVPIVENVALARELYALTAPGDEIPVETYVAVAAIVNESRPRRQPV